jgi:DNA-binding IclR family transcriptional regulator
MINKTMSKRTATPKQVAVSKQGTAKQGKPKTEPAVSKANMSKADMSRAQGSKTSVSKASVSKIKQVETKAKATTKVSTRVVSADTPHPNDRYVVMPVYKALELLLLLTERGKLTLKEAYVQLGMSKPQTFRYLQTLRAIGFAEYNEKSGEFQLGLRSWELGRATSRYTQLLELALPYLEDLRDRFNETVNLGTLSGSKVIYLGMVESSHSLRMHATTGSFDPIYTTSLGKAMLAFFPEETWTAHVPEKLVPRTHRTITSREVLWKDLRTTRERGHSLDEGENEIGACCVGAPLFDRQDNVVAAISLSAPSSRLQGNFIHDAAKAVIATANAISQRLKS